MPHAAHVGIKFSRTVRRIALQVHLEKRRTLPGAGRKGFPIPAIQREKLCTRAKAPQILYQIAKAKQRLEASTCGLRLDLIVNVSESTNMTQSRRLINLTST